MGDGEALPTRTAAMAQTQPTSNKPSRASSDVDLAAKLQAIVEFAKGRALELGKPDIAAAVHEVWRESLTHPRLTALLEAAISQRATEKQNEEFRCYVKRAKQRLVGFAQISRSITG